MDTRRDVLKKLLFGASALPLGTVAATATAKGLTAAAEPGVTQQLEWLEKAIEANPEAKALLSKLATMESAPAPWEMLTPLSEGSELALGWSVKSLSGIQLGGAILTLQHKRGYEASIHLCKNDGTPRGITHTRHFDVFVMNGGDGDTASEEELGRVVVTLGEVIRQNESKKPELAKVAGAMLPHGDRVDMFGPESLLA